MNAKRMGLFFLLASAALLMTSSLAVAAEKSVGTGLSPKDWIEIISNLGTSLGVLAAAILAWYRWGPRAGPPLMIRQVILIPPSTLPDIENYNLVIAVDLIFTNPTPISEYLTDLTIKITDPGSKEYHYSPYIYAKPNTFFEPDKTPKWVQGLFHPIHVPGNDQKQLIPELSKCLIFFSDQNTPLFEPTAGIYTMNFLLQRYSLIPWRGAKSDSKTFEMDSDMVKSLTPGSEASKVGLLYWHFKPL